MPTRPSKILFMMLLLALFDNQSSVCDVVGFDKIDKDYRMVDNGKPFTLCGLRMIDMIGGRMSKTVR